MKRDIISSIRKCPRHEYSESTIGYFLTLIRSDQGPSRADELSFGLPSQGCGVAAAALSIGSPVGIIWGPEEGGSLFCVLRISKISPNAPPWSELSHAYS